MQVATSTSTFVKTTAPGPRSSVPAVLVLRSAPPSKSAAASGAEAATSLLRTEYSNTTRLRVGLVEKDSK